MFWQFNRLPFYAAHEEAKWHGLQAPTALAPDCEIGTYNIINELITTTLTVY